MKFRFSENEDIAKHNWKHSNICSPLITLKDFIDKTNIIRNNEYKPKYRYYLNCRMCGDELIHKASKLAGICPSCDNM